MKRSKHARKSKPPRPMGTARRSKSVAGGVTTHGNANNNGCNTNQQATNRRRRKAIEAVKLIEKLAALYPRCFFVYERKRKPLKIGIHEELGPEFSAALWHYTGNAGYLGASVVAGTPRIDLQGNPAGEITTADADNAAKRLALYRKWRREHQGARRALSDETPRRAVSTDAPGARDSSPQQQSTQPKRLGLADLKTAAQARKEGK